MADRMSFGRDTSGAGEQHLDLCPTNVAGSDKTGWDWVALIMALPVASGLTPALQPFRHQSRLGHRRGTMPFVRRCCASGLPGRRQLAALATVASAQGAPT